jgi:hypothetical protein
MVKLTEIPKYLKAYNRMVLEPGWFGKIVGYSADTTHITVHFTNQVWFPLKHCGDYSKLHRVCVKPGHIAREGDSTHDQFEKARQSECTIEGNMILISYILKY